MFVLWLAKYNIKFKKSTTTCLSYDLFARNIFLFITKRKGKTDMQC